MPPRATSWPHSWPLSLLPAAAMGVLYRVLDPVSFNDTLTLAGAWVAAASISFCDGSGRC
jgi:hypothetical protein